jgi:hypothetical protein
LEQSRPTNETKKITTAYEFFFGSHIAETKKAIRNSSDSLVGKIAVIFFFVTASEKKNYSDRVPWKSISPLWPRQL